MTKNDIDQVVLNIEFLLVSVVQGVALAALASSAIAPINLLQLEYWPYILSAYLLILIFWSGAIIHALSFIDWPLDLNHSFFYFLASFVEVVAFSEMTNPLRWFILNAVFCAFTAILYHIDLKLIENHKQEFAKTESKKVLYDHIHFQQVYEMRYLVPAGLLFNALAALAIYAYPIFFVGNKLHLVLVSIQILFVLVILKNSITSFKKRSQLITVTIEN